MKVVEMKAGGLFERKMLNTAMFFSKKTAVFQ
jgi:hypothetical protein